MSFMKSWKMKGPSTNVAALNPTKVQAAITPEMDSVEPVKTVPNGMSKFKGLKRTLAKDRNLFKESKD